MTKSSLTPETRQRQFVLLIGLLFLFFFQLLSDFVAGIYAFGLLGTGIPNEIVSVLFLFSPLVLLFFKRRLSTNWLIAFAGLGLLCRFAEVLLDTRGRMLVSGLGVGALLIFFVGIYSQSTKTPQRFGRQLSAALVISMLVSILFRALNAGWDISTFGMFKLLGWIMVLVAAYLLWAWKQTEQPHHETAGVTGTGRLDRAGDRDLQRVASALLCLQQPQRDRPLDWTAPLVCFCGAAARLDGLLVEVAAFWISPKNMLLIWGGLFTIALLFTILPHQVVFPDNPQGYPLLEPEVAWWQIFPVYLMLITSPVLLAAFSSFSGEIFSARPTSRQLGAAFSVASLYILLLIFGQVFTTVYDYIPVVGPFFRDKFWLVFLILGSGVTLPLFVLTPTDRKEHSPDRIFKWWMVIIAVGALVSSLLLAPWPNPPLEISSTLRVLTYNVQQGYDAEGELNFDGQLAYIRSAFPDIIGLQESDTNRIAGGNADLVDYLAGELEYVQLLRSQGSTGHFWSRFALPLPDR